MLKKAAEKTDKTQRRAIMSYFQALAFVLTLLLTALPVMARGPAVEDFVGIEVDHPEQTPQGTEGLFNFEKEIHQYEAKQKTVPQGARKVASSSPEQSPSPMTIFTIALVCALPVMIWGMMMHNLRQRAKAESASNIEVLEKYRREKEEARKTQEDYRKVS
jgi:hypothetical protein